MRSNSRTISWRRSCNDFKPAVFVAFAVVIPNSLSRGTFFLPDLTNPQRHLAKGGTGRAKAPEAEEGLPAVPRHPSSRTRPLFQLDGLPCAQQSSHSSSRRTCLVWE